ncbi:shugoshin 1 isoform X2 [Hoplias malabaricus]|uniref:shugoshin 1 isoform X2 n=1 Tax=Hoplias malabaricus TaxID=27720 RepID=UPI003462A831
MVRERVVQKKSFQQSLDDIKEKMKEKRNQRLASASAASHGLSKLKHRNTVTVKPFVLKSVQVNNKALALALQAEREKVRQAHGVILQMKRERQALFFHLLMLKRALREGTVRSAQISEEPKLLLDFSSPSPKTQNEALSQEEKHRSPEPFIEQCSAETVSFPAGKGGEAGSLPATVGTRRRGDGKKRTERLRRRSSLFDPTSVGVIVTEDVEPPHSETTEDPDENAECIIAAENPLSLDQKPLLHGMIDSSRANLESELSDLPAIQHSTPEPPQRNASRKTKKRAAQPKPERGRKPERVPLKKPWENSKPRARSKSRDRSNNSKAHTNLNSSLGGNDTFDFDCEEAVHITPFRAGAKCSEPAAEQTTPTQMAPHTQGTQPTPSTIEMSPSESEDDANDSLYVPEKKLRRARSPPQRRARSKRRSAQKQGKGNAPKQRRASAKHPELRNSCAESSDNIEWAPTELHSPQAPDENLHIPVSPVLPPPESLKDSPKAPERNKSPCSSLPVTPAEEAELMIDSPFIDLPHCQSQSCEQENTVLTNKTKRRKGGLVVRSCLGLALYDVTNLSPAANQTLAPGRDSTSGPIRIRRRTSAVNYKEPSISSKLRRGDKFTDTQFLRSPIFKQKSRRSLKTLEKYNESFVGCR